MKRWLIIVVLLVIAALPASAAIVPLLTNNSFVYAGWVFGYSRFGSGRF
jgi:hypothetical protein